MNFVVDRCIQTKHEKLFNRKNATVLSEQRNKLIDKEGMEDEESGDDILVVKRKDHEIDDVINNSVICNCEG